MMKKETLKISIIFISLVAMLTSCNNDPNSPGYEFMPNMYRSPSLETYGINNVFKDKTVSDDYKTGGAYKAILNMFATQLDDEKFAAHCKKFFKGEDENNT